MICVTDMCKGSMFDILIIFLYVKNVQSILNLLSVKRIS